MLVTRTPVRNAAAQAAKAFSRFPGPGSRTLAAGQTGSLAPRSLIVSTP